MMRAPCGPRSAPPLVSQPEPAPRARADQVEIVTNSSTAHGVTRVLLNIPPIRLFRWQSVISDGQFALGAVRIKSSQPGEHGAHGYRDSFAELLRICVHLAPVDTLCFRRHGGESLVFWLLERP